MVWAHPRSRGENCRASWSTSSLRGSSPLTRGKRAGHGRGPGPEGLIPAHAGKTGCRLARGIGARAHPRSRGENARSGASRACRAGSSPLTRGKQAVDWRGGSARGLIPAHAGKTEAGRWSACRCRAHPRSRGENDGQAAHHCVRAGSSPLTRGKRDVGQHVTFLSGLIPAHAGKTWTWPGRNPRPTAHPRSRGENCCMARLMFSAPGSSPLTRGKLPPRSARGRRRGLIPAHAGKTCFRRSVWRRGPAHPRSRGENDQGAPDHVWPAGSSPLTRGKPGLFSYTGHQCGLIPAHAGKTRHFAGGGACHAAHPRSRGENPVRCVDGQAASGSSPLTRGKHMPSRVTPKQQRLIPAHAGKTARQGPGSLSPRAHPRSRGENTTTAAHPASTGGSSPLTRGKPALTAFAPATPRLIPAHAGKTEPEGIVMNFDSAHPRSRGENCPSIRSRRLALGSSPLTRGKHPTLNHIVINRGLIPAHAGKTSRG